MDRVVWTPYGFPGKFDGRYFVRDGRQHRLALSPRHVLADTAMDANTKRQVTSRLPPDVEFVCIRPVILIEISRAQNTKYLRAFDDPDPVYFRVHIGRAVEGMDR